MARVSSLKEFSQSSTSETSIPPLCPHCSGDISELSQLGRDNHREFCFLEHFQRVESRRIQK
jgi:hypothetical protein